MDKNVARKLFAVFVIIIFPALLGLFYWNFKARRLEGVPAAAPVTSSTNESERSFPEVPPVSLVAKNLEIPWALDFLPDGGIIFTERPGRVRLIDKDFGLLPQPILTVDEVTLVGEGGLLGIAVRTEANSTTFVYLYYTYNSVNGLANRVVRYTYRDQNLTDKYVVIDNIPGASIHNGGRIKFGPDGFLYISTGDASRPELAQDKASLAGKILRVKPDGTIPEDNPFPDSYVFTYGHRNPQGLAWDDKGRMWATEHGPQGLDEVNLIEKGKNYGWPEFKGNQSSPGVVSPYIHSREETWAPSGMAFYFRKGERKSLFFAGLRGQSLYELPIDGKLRKLKNHFKKKFGRLRDVVVGPDQLLYLLTSNRDGRGEPAADDDQIIRVNPEGL